MTPNEALIMRSQYAEGLLRQLRVAWKHPGVDRTVREMAQLQTGVVVNAPLYIWRDDLLSAAINAAETLPTPVTMRPDLFPTQSGLFMFNSPRLFPGCEESIQTISWTRIGDQYTAVYLDSASAGTKWEKYGPFAGFANFIVADGSDIDHSGGDGSIDWRQKTTDSQFNMHDGSRFAVRFLIASWLWMKQTVMSASPVEVNSRAKKIAARLGVDPTVNVVMLRRKDHEARNPAGSAAVEYSCQWLVSGHWRQQYYPSKGANRPVWIEPYVKGPEDKPFKAPAQTVYSVVR